MLAMIVLIGRSVVLRLQRNSLLQLLQLSSTRFGCSHLVVVWFMLLLMGRRMVLLMFSRICHSLMLGSLSGLLAVLG